MPLESKVYWRSLRSANEIRNTDGLSRVLFYPTAVYATYVAYEERENGVVEGDAVEQEGERAPLLSHDA
jgi:hypothetical protein